MTFSLLVLSEGIPQGSRIFNLAALAVMCSIILHGVSDTPGADWLARRAARRTRDEQGAPAAA
jgi:NhaP-type Na+/H+ or K+/H+ antiporter